MNIYKIKKNFVFILLQDFPVGHSQLHPEHRELFFDDLSHLVSIFIFFFNMAPAFKSF